MKTKKLLFMCLYKAFIIFIIVLFPLFIGPNVLIVYGEETNSPLIEEANEETIKEEIYELEIEKAEKVKEQEASEEEEEIYPTEVTLEECIKKFIEIIYPKEENMLSEDDYIIFGENHGYLKGIPNRNKDQLLTRRNLARILCNVLNIQPIYSKDSLFSDIKGQLNEEYIKAAYAEYLMDGINSSDFAPNSTVQREEFEKILENIKSYKENSKAYKEKMKSQFGNEKAEKIKKLLSMSTYKSAAKKIESGTFMGILKKGKAKTFINGYEIPSFTYNDSTVILLSDLKYYGFNLEWDDELKTIFLHRVDDKNITGLSTEEIKQKEESLINKEVVHTNISVYAGKRRIPCYSVNNSSIIYINDLSLFGTVAWDGERKEVDVALNSYMFKDELNVRVLGNKIMNYNDAAIDVEIVHLWYDEKNKAFTTEEDIFYGIPRNGYETIHLEKYASYENKIYFGTVIKKTNLTLNPLYEKDINYYKSQKVIDYVCGVVKDSDEYLFSLVKPSIIIGTMKWSAGGFNKGEKVEILYGEDGSWYQCKSVSTEKTGRIPWGSVSIPPDPPTNKNQMTKEQLEAYVNKKGFTSQTNYFVWTDLDRQMTHVFKKENGSWKLIRSMLCSTGRNITPTPRGFFTIKERGAYFGKGYMCKNWVQIWGDYLYHSVLMDVTGTYVLETNVLGKRASHGCIRFSLENSKWFYDTIPRHTTVWIN